MKIILLHGDHSQKISDRLTKFVDSARNRDWKIVRLDSTSLDFRESLTNTPLFKESRLYILEIKKAKTKDLLWLKKNNKNLSGTLVIVNQGIVPKTIVSLLPMPDKTELMEYPKKIWVFLDSFRPKNKKRALSLLHEVVEKEPVELVNALLARLVKDLYLAKCDLELFEYPQWRVRKLKTQADKFTKSELKSIIHTLSLFDYEAKTGNAEMLPSLDLIIATHLQ